MPGFKTYGSIAVVEVLTTGEIAIESISITTESCELSGAWLISELSLIHISEPTRPY